jgi:type I restriction enzyme, S subunit
VNDVGHRSAEAEFGQVPGHWTVAPLSRFFSRITYGFTNPMPTTTVGPYMVTAKDIRGGKIDYKSARHTSWDAFENDLTDKSRPKKNDVLLTKDGSIGRIAICDREDICINQSVALIRPNDQVIPLFLKYLLEAPRYQERMESDSGGSTIKHIYITRVDKMQVAVPPVNEQQGIADILSTLDYKIDLNRRMNQTLEAMAWAIFKDWFVDFGPTQAKIAGRPAYLSPEIWALFPATMDCDDRPNGWRQRPVYEIAEFANGAAYKDMHFSPDRVGLPVIKIAELKAGVAANTKFTTTELGEKYRINSGEILFSWSGNPDTSIDTFIWDGGPAWLNQHIFRVRENGTTPRATIYFQLRSLRPVFTEIARNKQTTGLGHVTAGDMKRLMVCDPHHSIALAYGEIAGPLFEQIANNQFESHTLTTMRDLVLPKLMSGEIRLREAEKVLEALA